MSLISAQRFEEITQKFSFLKPVLVVGDIGIDKYTYGEVNRISPEAPVPVLEVNKEWTKLGLAANVADNFSALNVPSTLCGVTGDDDKAEIFESMLEEIGLKTWGLVRSAKRMTTVKERVTTSTQQICRIDYESKEDIDAALSEKIMAKIEDFKATHSALVLQDYGKGLLTNQLTINLIKAFNQEKIPVFVDPYRTKDLQIYGQCTLFKPNLSEARLLARSKNMNISTPRDLAKMFCQEWGMKKVAITMGGEGICIYEQDTMKEPTVVPTLRTEVFDVSGAGDTALSVLVASIVSGGTLEEAAWLANCASGVVVGKKGTATVSLDELTDFYKKMAEEYGA